MWDNVAIARNQEGLKTTLIQIDTFLKEEVGRLLFLRLLTAKSILMSAIKRTSSLGAHFIKES
jgi:L-aspartate oxidase